MPKIKKFSALIFLFGTIFLFAFLFLAKPVKAANYTATQDGNWNSAATWGGGGYPGSGDNATISGYAVTLTATQAVTNLSISGTGSLNCSSYDLTVNGTFTESGGAFTAPSGILTFNGMLSSFNRTGGAFNHNNGTVSFDNEDGTVTTSGAIFYDVIIDPGSDVYAVYLGDDITVAHNFSFVSGWIGGWHTISVAGAISIGADAGGGWSTLSLNGTGDQNISEGGGYFQNYLIINKTSGVANFSAATRLSFLTISQGILNTNGNNLGVDYDFINNGTLRLSGDETVTAPTLNAGSEVDYTATSGSHVIKNWDYTNAILKINGSGGTFTLPADITAKEINIAAGTLDVTTSNYNITDSGNWTNAGFFTARSGKVTFSATSILSGATTFYDFELLAGSTVHLTSAQTFTVGHNFTSTATSGSHAIMNATTGGSRALFPVAGTATVSYVEGTDIDSSGGNQVVTNGPIDNCVNWSTSIPIISITVTGEGGATTVAIGSTLQMSASVLPANATYQTISWSVTNGTGSATINSSTGLLTAVGLGTVTVTATAHDGSGITGTEQITVVACGGWLPGWNYRKKITISNTNVGSDLSNFPLHVGFASEADIGAGVSDTINGYDIRFADSCGTTLLRYEREDFSVSSGNASGDFWVKTPTITSASTTDIYIYYGNASANTDWTASTGTGDCSAITQAKCAWKEGSSQNFSGVWHLSAGTSASDSTSNANNSTGVYSTGPTATTGQINGASNFSGGGLTFSGPASPTNQTISLWMRGTNVAGSYQAMVVQDSALGFFINESKLNYYPIGTNNTPLGDSTWYYAVVANNSGNLTFYLNGNSDGTVSSATRMALGYFGTDDMDENFAGKLDEVRISSSVRSGDWIKFEYCNMISPVTSPCIGNYELNFASQEVLVAVTSITVTGAGGATTVNNGSTLQISAAVLPANATIQTVTWSVANGTGSATINSSGLLTATGAGTVTVAATAQDGSGVTGTRQITVIIPDTTPPTLSFTDNVETGPVTSDTITASWGDATAKKWDYESLASCPATEISYTKTDSDSMDQTTTTNNGKYICLYGADATGNSATLLSANDINISTGGCSGCGTIYYTINASVEAASANYGLISPSGSVSVPAGMRQSFAIEPDSGHEIADVLADGSSVGAAATYAFNNVSSNHTILAKFTYCGDGQCNATESCSSCSGDCCPITRVDMGVFDPISFSYSQGPITIPYHSTALISWVALRADSCLASGGPWSGSKAIPVGIESTDNLTSSQTYSITCTGPGGSASDSVTINVASSNCGDNFCNSPSETRSNCCQDCGGCPPIWPPHLYVHLMAVRDLSRPDYLNGTVIVPYNTPAYLVWGTTNADSCSASGSWSGIKPRYGSQSTGNVTSSKTYTLTCTGVGETKSDSITVDVLHCGNHVCESDETCESCPADCTCHPGGPTCSPRGDINLDGIINISDFSSLLFNWGTTLDWNHIPHILAPRTQPPYNECADISHASNGDMSGIVDITDFSIMLSNWPEN